MSTANLMETKILKELSAVMPSVRDNLISQSNPETLSSADDGHGDMGRMLKKQQVPTLYRGCRFDALKGSSVFLDQVRQIQQWDYKDPYLLSILSRKNGIGKTHLAWCLVLCYLWEMCMINSEKCFYKEYEILNLIKSTYDENGILNEEQQKKIFINKPILVIDDLFRTKRNEWALSVMFEIIDSRIDWQRPTIITSNLSIQEIQQLDSSIASRLNNSRLYQFEGDLKDWRTDK